MDWKIVQINKETDHKFLNFYTATYEVEKEEGKKKTTYFFASRNLTIDKLRIYRKEYQKPDAVLIGSYLICEGTPYLLLEKQFRPALNREVISYPAGLVDSGEDLFTAARRELLEETGYHAKEVSLLVPPSPTSEGLSDECNAVVLAELESKGEASLEEFEDIKAKLYSLSEVKAMLQDSSLLFSNSAYLLTLLLLERLQKKSL